MTKKILKKWLNRKTPKGFSLYSIKRLYIKLNKVIINLQIQSKSGLQNEAPSTIKWDLFSPIIKCNYQHRKLKGIQLPLFILYLGNLFAYMCVCVCVCVGARLYIWRCIRLGICILFTLASYKNLVEVNQNIQMGDALGQSLNKI